MSISMYSASVPVFQQLLGAITANLGKAQTHCVEKSIDPGAFLTARLFPDMFPMTRQVQIACDFARGVSARLAGLEVPSNDDKEQSFDELRALVARTLAFLDGLTAAQFDAAAGREIVTRPGTPKEKRFNGQTYLLTYGLPQFFFHVSMTYAILRHNGLEIGKRDYMGSY